jgi:hypothetical protein
MSQYQFGAGILFGTPTQDANGNAIAVPTPVQFGALQDVSMDISFDTKLLYTSAGQFPIAFGRGKGKIALKAAFAQMNGSVWNSLVFGQTLTAGIIGDVLDSTGEAIPATPFTITPVPPSSGAWAKDLGVKNANGDPMKAVASGPITGQYSVTAGAYLFAAADAGNIVYVNYQYSATSTTAVKSTVLNLPMGYAPTFGADLFLPYGGKQLVVTLPVCLASKLTVATKLDDFTIPSFDFDAIANSTGTVLTYSMTEA